MMNVLIADDEHITRRFLQKKVAELCPCCNVVGTAQDGREALSYFSQPIHLLITDIKMPDMDGLELMKTVKKRSPDTLLIIISGYGEFDYAQQAIDCGAMAYLLKPIVNAELKRVLDEAVAKLDRQGEATQPRQKLPPPGRPVEYARQYVHSHYMRPLSLAVVAEEIGLSASYLSDLFHKETGETFTRYLTRVRMEEAGRLVLSQRGLDGIAAKTGYVSTKHFLTVFKKFYGITPSEYRLANRAKRIER